MKTAVKRFIQLKEVVHNISTVDVDDKKNESVADTVNNKRKIKKLPVNKEPDIVPRMNRHALRLQEEKAKKLHGDILRQENVQKTVIKTSPNILTYVSTDCIGTESKTKARKEITNTNSVQYTPLLLVKTTKATEARLKHMERYKQGAAFKERQIREKTQRDAEIQKVRRTSWARALDLLRPKRHHQFSERKPWDPLSPEKKTYSSRFPSIKQTNGVARQARGIPHGESAGKGFNRGQQWETNSSDFDLYECHGIAE